MMKHDPLEDDPQLRPLILLAREEALEELRARGVPEHDGFAGRLWATQKRILRDKYGIVWKTPREMNPGMCFD